jgi:Calcium binding/KTSC domain
MHNTHTNSDRENRITNEVIVDCYDDSEIAEAWFVYLNDEVTFPFLAVVRLPQKGGQTIEKTMEVVCMDTDAHDSRSLRICIAEPEEDDVQMVSLSALVKVDTTPENLQVLNDWLYWHDYDLIRVGAIPKQRSSVLKRISVDSSMLSAIGYDRASKTLYAEFNSGDIWAYEEVSKSTFKELLEASSKGSFMRGVIIGMYPEYRVQRGRNFKW